MTSYDEPIRVVIADDHEVTRLGIRQMLAQAEDIQVIGEAQDGLDAQRLVLQLRPHILLLDLRMPGPRPSEIERWVRTTCPETVTLILTAHDRNAFLSDMMEAGVVGYLCKDSTSAERLIKAIRLAAGGRVLFEPEQVERAQLWRMTVGARWERLTDREREILVLIARGWTDRGIANHLDIQLKTVGNHVSRILDKLEMTSRTEAAVWAVKEGLIDEL